MKVKLVRITIGMQNVTREVQIEVDESVADIGTKVTTALESKTGALDLTDDKGNRVIVPVPAIAYVHLGSDEQRFIGFGA